MTRKPNRPGRAPRGGSAAGGPPARPHPRRDRRAGQAPDPATIHPAGVTAAQRPLDPNLVLLWGFHAVREALRSERRKPVRLYATEAAAARLTPELQRRNLQPVLCGAEEIRGRLPGDAVHQGLLLEARPLAPLDLDDLPDQGLVLVLDQITDPHNVGAILRTAAAFGAAALVATERHAPEMTGILAKAASGALEHVPIVSVVNLARTLEALGDRGYTRIGLDSEGSVALPAVPFGPAIALVLGAEGKGLRRLTRENCDVVARLDMPGPIKSLNVSNACAAALTVLHLRAPGAST